MSSEQAVYTPPSVDDSIAPPQGVPEGQMNGDDLSGDSDAAIDDGASSASSPTLPPEGNVAPSKETKSGEPKSKAERERAALTVVQSEARRQYKEFQEDPTVVERNSAANSLATIGWILSYPRKETLGTGGSLRNENEGDGVLKLNQTAPRLRMTSGDPGFEYAYDKRPGIQDTQRTTIPDGVVELLTFLGNDIDGNAHFLAEDSKHSKSNEVVLTANQVTELFLLNSYHDVNNGMKEASSPAHALSPESKLRDEHVNKVVAQMTKNLGQFIGGYNDKNPGSSKEIDLTAGIDDKDIMGALEQTSVSAKSVRTFAEHMQTYIATDTWGGTANDRTEYTKEINQIIDVLDQGLQPTASQLQRLMVIGATPRLDTQEIEFRQKIDAATKASKDTKELEDALTSLRDFRAGGTDSIYRQYLEAIVQGEVDPKDAEWLNDQLIEARDPWAILKSHDIYDDKCLAGKAFKHLKEGLDEGQSKKVEAWLTEFFRKNGKDIAMMGIFALFQMMTTMIGDAAKGASH